MIIVKHQRNMIAYALYSWLYSEPVSYNRIKHRRHDTLIEHVNCNQNFIHTLYSNPLISRYRFQTSRASIQYHFNHLETNARRPTHNLEHQGYQFKHPISSHIVALDSSTSSPPSHPDAPSLAQRWHSSSASPSPSHSHDRPMHFLQPYSVLRSSSSSSPQQDSPFSAS